MQKLHGNNETGLDELKAFVAVATQGSFAAAARMLDRDSSVLSRRISALERRLGARLVTRTTRAIILTEAGTQYLRRVRTILDELDAANLEASDVACTPRGVLRISMPLSFGRRWIAPLFSRFMRAYPAVKLDARYTDRYVDLVSEGFDLAVRVGRMADSSLVTRRIGTYRTMLAASPGYLQEHGHPQTPTELASHACLGFTGFSSWPRWSLARADSRFTFEPVGPLIADSAEVVVDSAVEGLGIVLAPDWLIVDHLRSGQLVELLPGWGASNDGPVSIVHPSGHIVAAKSRVFIDMVVENLHNVWHWPPSR
ncbi:LysR family transcriptional regulator [Bordetella holmesii]|uniref:Bacterial regulatory helix-turn-helix, lysR family protein n=1 Tax=Bordetella holmesii 1058 TaxID=1247648 RepID=A0ABN0RXD2_9BORD|nr:LysR family transcriptional regulator [Bordetella holmesii]EXX93949.1 bacterial regulatory helix-turn-helix, lysR family protein [Bordetella holmesii 1058]